MTKLDRLLAWLVIFAATAILMPHAKAQSVTRLCFAPASPVGNSCQDVTAANPLPITGSFSATGWPGTSQTTGTPISVTTGGVTGTLPGGAVVLASNVGSTNTAYCKLGASATTSDAPVFPNSWVAFTVGSATQLTCITSTSTTTVNMSGGAGLPTGAGGGASGSGGGGAITIASGAVASGAYSSGSIASGAFASGSVASGAFASGSLAAGSMVDFLTTRGTKAPGTAAANSMLTGCVYTAAGITLTDGQQAACQYTSTGSVLVSVANTNANGQATMANSSPVVIASNQSANALWGQGATGAAPPSGMMQVGANASGATGGLMAGIIQCDSKAVYDASTSGSTELQALTSGRTIYVCGYSIMSAGTANVKLIYGTGTACATGSANMTPAYQLTAQVGIVDGSPFYRGMKTASANALCINTSAGVAVQAIVYYAII